ncbi:hypothetical protein TWF281_003834 [Arthrobotrys megalospora]
MAFTPVALTIAILSLIGSITSFLGAGFITITYLILPIKRHFRHSLILNLAIADVVNSANNSASGLWRLIHRRDIPHSPSCIANGFIGQLSVQATDTSIFAIAIVTVWSLTRKTMIRETLPPVTTFLICISTWILPVTTSITILVMNKYGPVSGNWCWIQAKPAYLRYVMTHGWRLAFIFSEVVMYTYLHFYVRKTFGAFLDGSRCSSGPKRPSVHGGAEAPGRDAGLELDDGSVAGTMSTSQVPLDIADDGGIQPVRGAGAEEMYGKDLVVATTTTSSPSDVPRPKTANTANSWRPKFRNPFACRETVDDDLGDGDDGNELDEIDRDPGENARRDSEARLRRARRILLLNAYPAMYIILVAPGIINRLIEASGGSSKVMQVLQSSTQFVGLANAITYGWNEKVGRQLSDYISDRRGRSRRTSAQEIQNWGIKIENAKGFREGLKRDEGVLEDQGCLMSVDREREWGQNASSFHSQDQDDEISRVEPIKV